MDSGCEYNGYCSDVTRVWPVDGRFNKSQRELYSEKLYKGTFKLLRNLLELRIKTQFIISTSYFFSYVRWRKH